jgi:hypothetical protein
LQNVISPAMTNAECETLEPSSDHASLLLVLRNFYIPTKFSNVLCKKPSENSPDTFLSERRSEPSIKISKKRMETMEYGGLGLSRSDFSTNQELRDIFLLHIYR